MRRLTGEDAGSAPDSHAYKQPRPAKRKRHGGPSGEYKRTPQRALQPSVAVPQRADSLAACGFALGASLLRDEDGTCNGWRGSDAAARCEACGCGPGTHALLDTRSGSAALSVRRAYTALRDARALGYTGATAGAPLEATLARHAARLSRLLRSAASVAAQAEQAAALLPGIGSRPASALRFVALLDEAYAELFIGGCLAPPAASAALPPPHVHLASLLVSLQAVGDTCSECGPASPVAAGLLCRACTAINPQLAYVRLRDAEAAGPLGLRRLAAACLAAEGASPGPSGGTQRGVDPVGCDTLRRWQAAVRDRVAAWSAFACPDAAAARALAAFAAAGAGGALLEVGAGTGYWARYLEHACVSMTAHDVRPTVGAGKGRLNEYHASLPCWAAVQPGDAAVVASTAASAAVRAGKPPPVLFICYPPPCMSSDGQKDMALAALTAFAAAGGRQLALVGEWRGDTGSAALERALSSGWTLESAPLALPGYANTCAALTLWRHGASGSPRVLRWAPACVSCDASQPGPGDVARNKGSERPFLRDRLTRAVVVCSHACARAPAAMAALDAELRARHLPPLRHQRASTASPALPFAWEDCDAALGKLVWRSVGM